MLNKIKKTAFHLTGQSLVIHYKKNKVDMSFEVLKNARCDLNDLDEFCESCVPGYTICVLSVDQMVELAKKIYRHHVQESKKVFHIELSHKVQGLSNFHAVRQVGV